MAMSTYREHDMVQCPYDPDHKVKRTRIDIHISKCRRQIGRPFLRPCLFNPEHLAPSKLSEFCRHLETCPDKSSSLWVPKTQEDLESHYVVPVAGASRPVFSEPEEMWEVGPTAPSERREPPVPPVFRQVHGLTSAERRVYYRSLFENQVDYAPPRQPKDKASSMCFNQSSHAVHAKDDARKHRGAEAASPRTVLDDVNWPSCSQASQDHTGDTPSHKSWAQVVAPATDIQPRSIQANEPCSSKPIQARDAQPKQPRGGQARQPGGTQARQRGGTQASKARGTQVRQPGGAHVRQYRGAQARPLCGTQARPHRGTQDSPLCSAQTNQPGSTQARQTHGRAEADHPRVVHTAQNATPARTWADLFRYTTPASGRMDVDELAESLKGLGSAGPNEQ
ncbi:hypothetical protein HPB52_005655 [Rhipicephalus sanguineus]|uniref:CHHC U11-48K-type domain-containing protein n=1 Tax=Rhipicephalus sanguineus TaxID=34632 RepID=A0A9D4T8T3_RHISA|nr:hypothetical protein HPB52_005655 [Rhipicephalus sanguineus]